MAKRKRRRVHLGSPADVHTRKLAASIDLIKDFTEQSERLAHNGMCRQATDALLAATKAHGEAIGHRVAGGHEPSGAVALYSRLGRLRLTILDHCTRG